MELYFTTFHIYILHTLTMSAMIGAAYLCVKKYQNILDKSRIVKDESQEIANERAKRFAEIAERLNEEAKSNGSY